MAALGEEDRFAKHAEVLGMRPYPLGEWAGGNAFLAIAEDGPVFALMEEIDLVGGSISEAIENLVIGRRGARSSWLGR